MTARTGHFTLTMGCVAEAEEQLIGVTPRSASRLAPHWALGLLAPAAYALLSIQHYWYFVSNPRGSLPGGADGILYAWYFQSAAHSLTHLSNPFFSAAMNAPAGVNLMWNTAMPALSTAAIPLTVTLGPFVTVGLLLTVSPLISAWATNTVLVRMTGSRWGGFLGGLIYAFGPYYAGHSGHLNLIFAPLPPLMLLLLGRLLLPVEGRPDNPLRTGVLLGIVAAIQFLVAEEVMVLVFIAAVGGVLALVLVAPASAARRWQKASAGLLAGAGSASLIVGVPLWFQFFGAQALTHGVSVSQSRADVASFVRPSLLQVSATHPDIRANIRFHAANGAENTAYLGWPLVILCIWLLGWLAFRRDRFAAWWALTTGGLVLLSMGSPILLRGRPVGTGPWALVRKIPLLGGAGAVRFSLLSMLMIGLLLAWSLSKLRHRATLAVAVAVSLLAVLPLRVVAPFHSDRLPATPRFFTSSAISVLPTGSTVMVLPTPEFPRVAGMVWQIRSDLRFNLVGGYSVFRSGTGASYSATLPGFAASLFRLENGEPLSGAELGIARAAARISGVRYIVVTPQAKDARLAVAAAVAVTGCTPQAVADVTVCRLSR